MCGGTTARAGFSLSGAGLSPRVRGNLGVKRLLAQFPWVYPRVCGGTAAARAMAQGRLGLSPRVRGNRTSGAPASSSRGSIPACAGEPYDAPPPSVDWQVYPRVCGGTGMMLMAIAMDKGLSPRVRGNPNMESALVWAARSIPACAGEPFTLRFQALKSGVYPRVCGGTERTAYPAPLPLGLSPRVRGNPTSMTALCSASGSIPACAGEPYMVRRCDGPDAVYPRVCGGTANILRLIYPGPGLSPRVRGNRMRRAGMPPPPWSIPACAGEPGLSLSAAWREGVYPRVCGGTADFRNDAAAGAGLSPRVRGNLISYLQCLRWTRSIPACAGEPR